MSAIELELVEPEMRHSGASKAENNAPDMVGVIRGTLTGFRDEGRIPLVLYPQQPGAAAMPADSIVDLHSSHIGREVALMFENGEPHRPIIIGVLRRRGARPVINQMDHVEIDSDGERLIVSAHEQLVLRCGAASITLTNTGKILIEGAYVSSRSSGVNRIRGGSVQIN